MSQWTHVTGCFRLSMSPYVKSTDNEGKDYDTVYKTLGSQCEKMYKQGYDMADILERERYEKELDRQADMLEHLCTERGIKLWENPNEKI